MNRGEMAKSRAVADGSSGWDDYAPFYDWENARTIGRADVPFWKQLAQRAGGPVLELGCGTWVGAAAGGNHRRPPRRRGPVGADAGSGAATSPPVEARRGGQPRPLRHQGVAVPRLEAVLARHGAVRDPAIPDPGRRTSRRHCNRSRASSSAAARSRLTLSPTCPHGSSTRKRLCLRGPRTRSGAVRSVLTLVESVRQDRRRKLTDLPPRGQYTERRGRTARRLYFLSDVPFAVGSTWSGASRRRASASMRSWATMTAGRGTLGRKPGCSSQQRRDQRSVIACAPQTTPRPDSG